MAQSTMKTVRLGMTDLEVSPIAFGTWQLGGECGQFDKGEAIEVIREARDLGVNLFDTALGYGFGASERLLGRALRSDLDSHRDEVVIATKGGLRMTDDGLVRDSRLATLQVLRSRALGTGATIFQALIGTVAGIVAGGLLIYAIGTNEAVLWAALPPAIVLAAYAPRTISFAA